MAQIYKRCSQEYGPPLCNACEETSCDHMDEKSMKTCLGELAFVGDMGSSSYWTQCKKCRAAKAYKKNEFYLFDGWIWQGQKPTSSEVLEKMYSQINEMKKYITNDYYSAHNQVVLYEKLNLLKDQLTTLSLDCPKTETKKQNINNQNYTT